MIDQLENNQDFRFLVSFFRSARALLPQAPMFCFPTIPSLSPALFEFHTEHVNNNVISYYSNVINVQRRLASTIIIKPR